MRVLFDTSALKITSTGVSIYISALLAAMRQSGKAEIKEMAYQPLFSRNTSLRIVDSFYRDLFWQELNLTKKVRRVNADILHFPAFNFPVRSKLPMVITIHDVYSLVSPGSFKTWHRRLVNHYIQSAIRQGRNIVVPSAFTRQQLACYFPGADLSRIHVVHSGISEQRFFADDPQPWKRTQEKYGLKRPYLLSVSTIEPRKNFLSLIRAFAAIQNELEHDLVLVGQNGWKNTDVYKTIEDLHLTGRVKFTGFVSDEDLNLLYSHADCFVFPSLYEGFGFTPLEAMKCGCPVVSSNAACMPEVLGDAAMYFHPADIDDMARAILAMVKSNDTIQQYRAAGMKQASNYSWTKTAAETLAVYGFIINQHNKQIAQ